MHVASADPPGAHAAAGNRRVTGVLLHVTDAIAAGLLAADLAVVIYSVLARSLFTAPVEWADDVARGLMVASAFFGAASALARGENPGVIFFRSLLPQAGQDVVEDASAALVLIVAAYVALHAIELGWITSGQTTGAGLPLQLTFYPMGLGAACMALFAAEIWFDRSWRRVLRGLGILAAASALFVLGDALIPQAMPSSGTLMLLGFVLTLTGGLPIGFALALAALIFIWAEGALPGVIFAQQMARGIDNFVLLAIPFFILVGYLMEANGMSVRLIELLQRLVGRMRGGLNVVMVTAMVLFSGISGSKMADVAAVGAVLIPASRKSGQNPGSTVALLAASAVMAETIPPCINLIILGFVANLSIGGLFAAGILPASLMAAALIAVSILFGKESNTARPEPLARAVAPLANAMGMRVLISDPHVTVEEPRFQQVDLATLLAQSDHVVCLAVANETTENLINAEAFAKMRRDAVFINVSRGNLVDEAALAAAIREGKIAGAALDVGRAPDQMPTPAIAALPNVIATPHIGGLTPPAIEAQALHTVEQVRALISGRVPEGAVNTETWTRRT